MVESNKWGGMRLVMLDGHQFEPYIKAEPAITLS